MIESPTQHPMWKELKFVYQDLATPQQWNGWTQNILTHSVSFGRWSYRYTAITRALALLDVGVSVVLSCVPL